ncbi:MAG TPA: type VI secretion system lipoprotein TssJ [Gammaproteobacteria bacterium]|nr:type VI secretion system lipoprotein TssJ [Gammaproteobacteria bacterium]
MKLCRYFKWVFFAGIVLFLSACQSMNGAVGGYLGLDTDLRIVFNVDADINPDEFGKASPLFIRMYELQSKKMIRKADFIEMYERDKEMLGADLVVSHRLKRFKPGESREEPFVLDKKTRYVALYAEFFNFKGSKYKLIIPVVANNVIRNSVTIRVSGNELIFDEPIEEELNDGSGFKDDFEKTQDGVGKAQGAAEDANGAADSLKEMF